MTKQDLTAIIKQAVVDMKYRPGLVVNSFLLTDTLPNFSDSTFGATYKQFEAGSFWSRHWFNQGASRSKIKADFPVLLMDSAPDAFSVECPGDETGVATYDIIVVDRIGCEECPDGPDRSPEQVSDNCFQMLKAIIDEVYNYALWDVFDQAEQQDFKSWISKGRIEAGQYDDGFDVVMIDDIVGHFMPNDIVYRQWGNNIERRGYAAQVSFMLCPPGGQVEFNYQSLTPKKVGVVKAK